MKEQLKKADLLGLAIIAAAIISYSVRSVWTMYQTIAVVIGGVLVLASLVLRADLRPRPCRISARSMSGASIRRTRRYTACRINRLVWFSR